MLSITIRRISLTIHRYKKPRLCFRFSSTDYRNQSNAREEAVLPKEIIAVLEQLRHVHFDDRLELQQKFTLAEKGWRVPVEWKLSDSGGIGVFAKESISKSTVLRIGIQGCNLIKVESIQDIERFCSMADSSLYHERLRYVANYIWGFFYTTDDQGYPKLSKQNDTAHGGDERFFGFWIPGNGLNHNETPNTVYRATVAGINLVALENIEAGQELFDDYRRHGTAPRWLKDFASDRNLHLNFADCNDFVT